MRQSGFGEQELNAECIRPSSRSKFSSDRTANVICQGGSCSDATLPRYCTWLCRNDGDCTAARPHCLPQTFGATTMNVCKR
jgi:hypothetical protein